MSFIEKSVARLDQADKLEQLAFDLGRSHWRYKAPPKYYEVRRAAPFKAPTDGQSLYLA